MLTEEILIVPAKEEDIPAMSTLLGKLFTIEDDFEVDENKQKSGLNLMLSNGPGRQVLVAKIDGTVIGMCSAQINISTSEGGISVLIEDLIINEDYRNHGIGRKLLACIKEWALSKSAKRMTLSMNIRNSKALSFYSRQGWILTNMISMHSKLNA